MKTRKSALAHIGRKTLIFLEDVGGITLLIKNIFKNLLRGITHFHSTAEQMVFMGINSFPLVFTTSIFTGGVSAVQFAYQFADYVPMRYLGTGVGKAVIIELGPVLTALVVAGRVGASIAAELGTMKVTEQIDALESLAIDPVKFLVVPRFLSGIIMLPVLVVVSDIIAILGGLGVSVFFLRISPYTFINGLKMFFYISDVLAGLFKALVFGGIISVIGCYQGFRTQGGAEGVGRSTTRAVVLSSVLILISDYIIASILFSS
jgi:phospholipid/cholesterol/gamma-HCH transport system permease protein